MPTCPPAERTISPAGRALVMRFEACGRPVGHGRFAAYPDPASGGAPWTIGWGTTGPDIHEGLVWTKAECDARFDAALAQRAAEVNRVIGAAPTTNTSSMPWSPSTTTQGRSSGPA